MAILLKGWILPIGGVASGRVCAFHRIGPLGRFDLVVAKSVCLCVCPLFMWYILRPILPPLPEVGCQTCLEIRNP